LIETPSNPLMRVVDIRTIVARAKDVDVNTPELTHVFIK
jgi:cystathionine beta-lyase/cystathionine gamma-synthase